MIEIAGIIRLIRIMKKLCVLPGKLYLPKTYPPRLAIKVVVMQVINATKALLIRPLFMNSACPLITESSSLTRPNISL
jgi:hypothetical protein